jgi:hypothetical protein
VQLVGFGKVNQVGKVEVEVRPANGGVSLGVVEFGWGGRGGGGVGGTEIGEAGRWREREREWSGKA